MHLNGRLRRLYAQLIPAQDVQMIERLTFAEYKRRIEERLGSQPHGSEMPIKYIVEMRESDDTVQE